MQTLAAILLIACGHFAVADVAKRTLSFRKPEAKRNKPRTRHLQSSGYGDVGYGNEDGPYGYSSSGQGVDGGEDGPYGYSSSGQGVDGGEDGPYGYSSSGGVTPPYGGSSGEGPGDCAEMYCYTPVFTATGEPNWEVEGTASCASYEKGCPCNDQWQVQCESFGYKTCELKSEGCYDPFAVECNEATEVKCTDEYSSYCWDKEWGSCPVYCKSNQTTCYATTYLSTGEVDYAAPATETCVDLAVGCTCDQQWEEKCTDSSGYSWCTPKFEGCPLECQENEQVCYTMQYTANGEVDFAKAVQQSCVSMDSPCPCNTEFEDQCTLEDWSYCQPKSHGSCPLSCTATEHHCFTTPYDAEGFVDYEAEWEESCVTAAEGCPCDSTWEKRCNMSDGGDGSYSWCTLKSESCPIDCGEVVTCYHHSGNYSCATESGCTCEADEMSCQDAAGKMECFAKEWYGESCPLVCDYETHNYCYEVGFDGQGMMIWTEYCHLRPSADDWDCPVICKSDSAKKCGSGWDAYCIGMSEECPEECTAEQQLCVVPNYDTSGTMLSSPIKCAASNEECPCGDNTVKCTYEGWSYCESTAFGCPITCAADEKLCDPISYTAEGEWDFTAQSTQSCVKQDQTCPCGANAKPCKWTDDWGYEEEYCAPQIESCPVTCSEGQKRCYRTDFNSSGYPESESESCVPEGQSCQCGTHSQTCYDPWFEGDVCYPMWDFWSNKKFTCPVVCAENEQYCFIPSYDAKGNWISTAEMCVAQGQSCDCSQGQNSFSCTWNDPDFGAFVECLPTHGGYCPYSNCPQGQVSCSMVEDYLPNGTSLGWVQPAVKCAASLDQCPCGKEAERCPSQGCLFKDEGCAQDCGSLEKKCYLIDYAADGSYISDRETCVPSDQPCPCGKNANKCANTDLCLPQSELDIICPCKASQTTCPVVNYDKDGKLTSFMTLQCVKEGDACPCGKNTISCPDPNDVTARFCVPTAQHNTCPQPCTAEAIAAGNKTCVRTNLDSEGNFKSQSVTCIGGSQRCGTGEGMKLCPSGAVISVGTTCIDLYGAPATQTRRLSTTTAKRETCNAIITMSSLRSDAKKNVETVRVKITSVLQVSSELRTTLAIKTTTGRRLQTGTSTSTMIFGIDNQGITTTVTPTVVCEQLKKMVKSSSPSLTDAVAAVGVMNSQVGVNLEIATSELTSRSKAAVVQRQQQAGITVRTTASTSQASQATSSGADLSGGFDSATTFCPLPMLLAQLLLWCAC